MATIKEVCPIKHRAYSMRQKQQWQDPIYRERMQKQISAAYTRRMKLRLIALSQEAKKE